VLATVASAKLQAEAAMRRSLHAKLLQGPWLAMAITALATHQKSRVHATTKLLTSTHARHAHGRPMIAKVSDQPVELRIRPWRVAKVGGTCGPVPHFDTSQLAGSITDSSSILLAKQHRVPKLSPSARHIPTT
jgi:hypothetical protein